MGKVKSVEKYRVDEKNLTKTDFPCGQNPQFLLPIRYRSISDAKKKPSKKNQHIDKKILLIYGCIKAPEMLSEETCCAELQTLDGDY